MGKWLENWEEVYGQEKWYQDIKNAYEESKEEY